MREHQLRGPLLAIGFTLAFGVVGYMIVEGWSLLDAVFMTVITVTTVGYGEVNRLSPAGRIFTIVLILVGAGTVLYSLSSLFGWLLATDWPAERRRRRMDSTLASLRDHFILCGYGRVGRGVAATFRREGLPCVVVDSDPAAASAAEADGFPVVRGDAAGDEVLLQAGIDRARGLVAAVTSDADNVYVVLSARGLRPDLLVVARASSAEAESKLRRAGANHVLSPYTLAGERMAMLGVKPTAVELAETLLRAGRQELVLEELRVTPESHLVGRTIGELRRQSTGQSVVVAVRHGTRLFAAPPEEDRLVPGDALVVIGSPSQLRALEALA